MSHDPLATPCQASTLDTSVSPTGSLELEPADMAAALSAD